VAVRYALLRRAAIPRLGQILASRTARPITRVQAANALGRMGDAAAVVPLARAMDAAEDVVRRQVARALGEIGHPEAVPHLQRLSTDRSRVVAEAAGEALRLSGQRLGLRLPAAPARKKVAARRPRTPGLDRGQIQ
jgi:HEAT repeat protein